MASYQVELYVLAHTPRRRGEFTRTIRLPFVPAEGMSIVLQDDPEDGEGDVVRSVRWLHRDRKFLCHVGDDYEEDDSAWEHVVRDYERRGFRLQEEGFWVEAGTGGLRPVNPEEAGEPCPASERVALGGHEGCPAAPTRPAADSGPQRGDF